jgi:hypothetical protein
LGPWPQTENDKVLCVKIVTIPLQGNKDSSSIKVAYCTFTKGAECGRSSAGLGERRERLWPPSVLAANVLRLHQL